MTRSIAAIALLSMLSCCRQPRSGDPASSVATYQDLPFVQDYSIKYPLEDSGVVLEKVYEDRNGVLKILSSKGLLHTYDGEMLYPGQLMTDSSYRSLNYKQLSAIGLYRDQFVYADDKAVLSNAWAGTLYCKHGAGTATVFSGGEDFSFLVSGGSRLQYTRDSKLLWEGSAPGTVEDIVYDSAARRFLVLTPGAISSFSPESKTLSALYTSDSLTCFTLSDKGRSIVAGTVNGWVKIDAGSGKQQGEINRRLPCTALTSVAELGGNLWFGSEQGAFMLKADGKYNYYASKRWLPSDRVKHISGGKDGSVLVLTEGGLGRICFKEMTLAEKAAFYDRQVRLRHIRYGLYCDVTRVRNGNLSADELAPHDSDNLWTSMYLGSQLFRYLVTHDPEARQNCIEAFEGMERLFTINNIPGYFGRSYERHGIMPFKKEVRDYLKDYWYKGYDSSVSWTQADNPEWDWRGASSSDQTVGQMFALTLIAQYMDDENLRKRAVTLMDGLMSYIVDNELRLIDFDGKPTLWGIWHPEYVNRFPEMVGDRKLYSSNIIAFLQTAYHFTHKEKYKQVAEELLYKQGYLKNLSRPISSIGRAPDTADAWSRALSEEWNHSDDEMYFLAYWGLYPYAFNDSLKSVYKEAIRDHWEAERPEKDALWNFCYAITGAKAFDLNESIWFLKEMPMDMVEWPVHNSSRKDINTIPQNFRGQITATVLPPDERPELKHNRNLFTLNRESGGNAELGAGDVWLLPYWMGRYLGIISNGDH